MMPSPPASEPPATRSPSRAAARGEPRFICPAALGGLIVLVTFSLIACTTTPSHESAAPDVVETPANLVSPVVPTPVLVVEPIPAAAPEQIEEDNIYFESGSTTIDVRGKIKLRTHADRLKADPDSRVTLVGHTDDLGSRNYNLALAEQRMLAVSHWLRKYGVRSKQIRRYRGDGERVPNSCKSAECRQKMRRVELVSPPP